MNDENDFCCSGVEVTENDFCCNGAEVIWIEPLVLVVFRLMVVESCQIYQALLAVLVVSVTVEAAQYTLDEY